MGVLIVAGVVVLGVALTQRISAVSAPIASAVLDEPAGTRITGATMAGDRMAVVLSGMGPDRVVVVDLRSGKVLGRVGFRAP